MPQIILSKPASGEHTTVQLADKAGIQCMFSAQQAAVSEKDGDLVFTFPDGSTITVSGYYNAAADTADALPPISMDGEAVPAPPAPLASQEAADDSPADQAPQQHADAAAKQTAQQPTVNNPAQNTPQNSSASQSASQQVEGARFHNFDTSDLMDGINRLPGLDLPWGQKFYESHVRYGGWDDDDSSGGVAAIPNDEPILTVESVTLAVTENGVRATSDGVNPNDPNAEFTGESTVSGKVSATDPDGDSLTYGFLSNGQVVQTLTTPYGTVVMAPDGTYTYTLNNDAAATQGLKQDQKGQDSFEVAVSDGKGGVASETVTVDITGTNDRPELALTEISFVAVGKQTVYYGESVGTDKDNDDLTYTLDGGIANPNNPKEQYINDAYGKLYINTDTGAYRYELDTTKPPLADGSKHTKTVTVTVIDGDGAHSEKDLTIELEGNGTYEPPLSMNGTATEAGVLHGGNTATPGVPTYSEKVDLTDTAFATGSPNFAFIGADGLPAGTTIAGTYGTFTINADGTCTYTLDNTKSQGLSEGEKQTDNVTILVTGPNGAHMEVPVKVEVTGTNDAPVITKYDQNLSVTEVSDTTDASDKPTEWGDVDSVPTHSFSIADFTTGSANGATTMQGQYGTLTIDASGNYTYTLTSNAFQAGQTGKEVFNIVVKDAEGAYDIKPVTVTITGTSSAPVFEVSDTYALSFVESGVKIGGNDALSGTAPITKTATVTDADDGDKDSFAFSITDAQGHPLGNGTSYTDAYGTLSINQNGNYTYTLDQDSPTVQALQNGNNTTHTVYIAVTDSTGHTVTQALTITIAGSNDKPTITGAEFDNNNAPKEDAPDVVYTGKISSTDVDVDKDGNADADSLTHSIVHPNGALVQVLEGKYGRLQLNEDGTYTYTLDNSKIQHLGEGDKATDEVFKIQVKDSNGAYTEKDVPFIISGTNDSPVISGNTATLQEDNGTVTDTGAGLITPYTATGTFKASDVDQNDTPSFSLVGGIDTGNAHEQRIEGKYGFLLFNSETGQYTYTLTANNHNDIQKLNAGGSINESFDIKVTSGNESVDSTIKVSISGTNDNPIITTAENLEVNIGGTKDPIVHGKATADDIDDVVGNLKFYMDKNSLGQESTGKYGTLTIDRDTGEYTYALNPYDPDYIGLITQATDEKFTIWVKDEHGGWGQKEITVTVNPHDYGTGPGGAIPPVRAENLEVQEDDAEHIVATGKFWDTNNTGGNTSDDTVIESLFFVFKLADGTYVKTLTDPHGSLTINGDGTYTYTLNNDSATVQALAEGQKVTIKLPTGATICLNGQVTNATIEVTITGTNDAPEITVVGGSLQETINGGSHEGEYLITTVTGTCTVTDVDTGDAGRATYWLIDANGNRVETLTLTWGTVTIDSATGTYTYTLTNTDHRNADTVNQEKFTVEVDDGSGTSTSTDRDEITIDIKGTNEAPEITAAPHLMVTEDGASTDVIKGKMIVDDDTAGLKYSITGYTDSSGTSITAPTTIALSKYGTLMLNADGSYQYVLNNQLADVQGLGANDPAITDSFTVTVTDKHGEKVTTTIDVTIKGTNDAPTLEIDNRQLVVTEDGTLSAGGTATTHDVDKTDTHSYTDNSQSVVDKNGHPLSDYGTFTIGADGKYIFTLASNDKVDALKGGEQLNFTIKLTTTDAQGASSSQDIAIVINGTNDAPTVTNVSQAALNVTEGGSESITGTIAGHDAEGEKLGYWLVKADGTLTDSITTDYGTMHINTATGEYSYTPKTDIPNFGAGATHKEDYTLAVTDPHAATPATHATEKVTVTINGADDAPPITYAALFNDTDSLDSLLPPPADLPEGAEAISSLTITDMQDTLEQQWTGSALPDTAANPTELFNDTNAGSEMVHPPVDTGVEEQAQQTLVLAVLVENGAV